MARAWQATTDALYRVRMAWAFDDPSITTALTEFTKDIAIPKTNSLGWNIEPEDDDNRKHLKAVCFPVHQPLTNSQRFKSPGLPMTQSISASDYVNIRAIKGAKAMFAKWNASQSSIPSELVPAVLSITMAYGSREEVPSLPTLCNFH